MTSVAAVSLVAILIYGAAMYVLARRSASRKQTLSSYHVANREVGLTVGSLSIASTWVWAPALFVSATQAYTNGWVGVLWFVVPNAASLLIMLPLAARIREKYPNGFTLSGLMRRTYGKPTQGLYIAGHGGLATLSVSVNLLAGGAVISMLTGLPLIVTSTLMLLIVLAYTVRYGVKASVITDVVQILLIIGVLLALVPSVLQKTGWDALAAGIDGVNGVASFFGADGRMVALSFGIISAIGLAAGPVGDQAFWQRAFSMKTGEVKKAFGLAALFFTIVPVLMSFFGWAAAGIEFVPENPGYVNLDLVAATMPTWVLVPFSLLAVSALFSIVNSHLLAISTLAGDATGSLRNQRVSLLVVSVIALIIANVPGNSVTNMFLIYSTLRSATFVVTTVTLLGTRWNRHGVTLGISLGMGIGFPFALWANLVSGLWQYRLSAILVTTLVPPVVAIIWTAIAGKGALLDQAYETPAERDALRQERVPA